MTGKVANMSNYPNGFTGGLLLEGVPTLREHSGKVFYVGDTNSAAFPNRKGASNINKGGFLDPFATLDYAIEQCTEGRGDVIRLLPGTQVDVETSIEVDVEGIAIQGMGFGDDRPQLELNIADALDIEADNVTIANVVFIDPEASSAPATTIDVVGANFHMVGCKQFIGAEHTDVVTITATAHGAVFASNDVDGEGASEAWLDIEGAAVGVRVLNNYMYGGTAPTSGWIDCEGQSPTDLVLSGNQATSGVLLTQTAVTRLLQPDTFNAPMEVTAIVGEFTSGNDESFKPAINGTVDIYGVWFAYSAADDTGNNVTVTTESGVTLVASTETEGADAATDVWYTPNLGGAATVDEIATAESVLANAPLRISGAADAEDLIDVVIAGGTEGHGRLYVAWANVDGAATSEVEAA